MKLVILILTIACTLFVYKTGYLSNGTKKHDFETPANYVGTDADFYRFLIKTCRYNAANEDRACADNMIDAIELFGVDSEELQIRAIYWSVTKNSSPDDLLTGHSDLKALPPRNLITNANYVGNSPQFNNFLIQVCGVTTERLDMDCFDGMIEPYDKFGVKSLEVQARAVYWNYKKAEEALAARSQTITYTSLRCITPVVQHITSSITPVVQHITSSPHVIWLVIVLVLIACYRALARLTKPDAYALPLPNHYETTKTQRHSSGFYLIKNYFYGPKSLDLPLPGAYDRKVYKYTV